MAGVIFQLITDDLRADRLLSATALLNARLREVAAVRFRRTDPFAADAIDAVAEPIDTTTGPVGTCSVCLESVPLRVCRPCNHAACCGGCASGLVARACPLCRAAAEFAVVSHDGGAGTDLYLHETPDGLRATAERSDWRIYFA